jgi:Fic family protein
MPNNVEEIKRNFRASIQSELFQKLESIKKNFSNEWKTLPQSVKQRELTEIAIAFTYNTNAIEGSTITLHEVREIIENKIAPNKPLSDVHEAEQHANVFLSMLSSEAMNEETVLKWHHKMFGETKTDIAGKYREYIVRVGSYVAPDWQDIPEMMRTLFKFISQSTSMNPVERAARSHYQFEKIHPFGDGNGRIGRLLMNQMLWHAQYPMLIIEYKKRKSYYRALSGDEDKFVQYFFKRYLAVHEKRTK